MKVVNFSLALNESQLISRIRAAQYWAKPFKKEIKLGEKVPQNKKPLNFEEFEGVFFTFSETAGGGTCTLEYMFFPSQSNGTVSIGDTVC